jgi:hypothetical protein
MKWEDGLTVADPKSDKLGWVFIVFGFVMALGGFYSWAWIPSVQYAGRESDLKIVNRNLEELGEGLNMERGPRPQDEVIGVRAKVGGVVWRRIQRFRNPYGCYD